MLLCHRLFFALVPSKVERARTGLVRDQQEGIRSPVSNDRLHMTLAITGDYRAFPQAVADRMVAIGEKISADPFLVTLDRLSGGARSVALRPSKRLPELVEVQRQLGSAMTESGILRDGWHFNPHVTLGYREDDPFVRPVAPIEWAASEIVLIHSAVGETQHTTLARWVLKSDQLSLFNF